MGFLDKKSLQSNIELYPISSLDFAEWPVTWTKQLFLSFSYAGIQEGTQCTKCKNEWALKTSIALLYVLCTLLTIAVAVLGYKGKNKPHYVKHTLQHLEIFKTIFPLNVDPIKIALGGDLEKHVAIKFIQCKWNLTRGQGAEAENVPLCPLVSIQHFCFSFFFLFTNTPQSSHLQVMSSIFSVTELPGCPVSYFPQFRKRSCWLSEEWTLNVLAIIVLNAPVCKRPPPLMWNDMKLTCAEVIFAPHVHYDVGFCTHTHTAILCCMFLNRSNWSQMSPLRASPAKPTEIGFLLALKHCYVRGTTVEAKHTPDYRWLSSGTQSYVLNMCASSCDDLQTWTLLRLLLIVVLIDTTRGSFENFPGLQKIETPLIFPQSGPNEWNGNNRIWSSQLNVFTISGKRCWILQDGPASFTPTHTTSGCSPNKNNNSEYFLRTSWPK